MAARKTRGRVVTVDELKEKLDDVDGSLEVWLKIRKKGKKFVMVPARAVEVVWNVSPDGTLAVVGQTSPDIEG